MPGSVIMKSNHVKPLVTISTYEERQVELNKATVMRDEVDRAPNGFIKTENKAHHPMPPPPPQFANGTSNGEKLPNTLKRQQISTEPPNTPTPDYDSSPSHTLPKYKTQNNNIAPVNGSIKGTLRRVTATEMAKANGDIAELESIESFKLQNPSSPIPRPPSLYFAPQNSGPPTMKKTTRPVSVTIGEYGGQNFRKEPSKFDFISKENGVANGLNGHTSPRDENVSEMLRSELEKTLSRSNLKKKDENIINNNLNTISNGKPVLQKTQSSNIEKLANMLQRKQSLSDANCLNGNGSISSSNRVSINIPNKVELRKTESTPPTPTNGILKNGYNKPTFSEKSITFGN